MEPITIESAHTDQTTYMQAVYGWMAFGLVLTSAVAFFVAINPLLINVLLDNIFLFYGILIFELLLVLYISSAVQKMSLTTLHFFFILYAVLNGVTFSVIFLIYELGSIGSAFLITAGMFAVMSVYGYVTKKDLTSVGNLALMALVGLILASVVNLFLNNAVADLILSYIGVLIFVALTAYDTQRIKNLAAIGMVDSQQKSKQIIMGALTLYLDFINLFLKLLRIIGRRRS